jgi:GH25 family lysozyme M1 (1,4-beta-N-acetylmuramidase)
MAENHGFDVSHYQGDDFPWTWSRDQGHDLASCKATEGTRFVDPTFAHNRQGMSAAGFRYRGMYCWIKPRQDVSAQVDHFVSTVGDLDTGEFVQIDCEESPLTSEQMWTAFSLLSARYPGRVIVYAGYSFASWTTDGRFANCPWWIPWYGPQSFDALQARAVSKGRPLPWQPILWQWGGGAQGDLVPGLDKRVDSNQIIDRDSLEAIAGYSASSPFDLNRPATGCPDRLGVGEGLGEGEQLVSGDGSSFLVHQLDGNVVVYNGEALWASETCGQDTNVLMLQDDGNVVLVGPNGPVWASDTAGSGGTTLVMQDDSNLVLYNDAGPVWASSSAQAPHARRTVTVQAGDGWIAIANRAGCDWKLLASINGGERRMLHPGDELDLP